MARRYRRKKQDDSSIVVLLGLGILGLGLSAGKAQSQLIAVFALAIILASTVIAVILIQEKRKRDRLARSGIHEIDEMDGLVFEKYLQTLLKRKGYQHVSLTTTYDLGVDLIAEKDGIRWAIQAKRYKGLVGLDAVRQVVAAANHYHCDKSMVITNSYFTRNAKTIAESTGCTLIDRDQLISLILESQPLSSP